MKAAALSELVRLLTLPLAMSALLVAAWAMGESAEAEVALAVLRPVAMVAWAVAVLVKGSERALMFPTPLMMWLVFVPREGAGGPWPALLVAQVGVGLLLWACWRGKRGLACGAAVATGLAAGWLEVSAVLQA